jgi:hypothetical protein
MDLSSVKISSYMLRSQADNKTFINKFLEDLTVCMSYFKHTEICKEGQGIVTERAVDLVEPIN